MSLAFGGNKRLHFFRRGRQLQPVQQLGDITTCLCRPCSFSHGPLTAAAVPAITGKKGRKDQGGHWEMKPSASAALHYNKSGQGCGGGGEAGGGGASFPTRAGDLNESD